MISVSQSNVVANTSAGFGGAGNAGMIGSSGSMGRFGGINAGNGGDGGDGGSGGHGGSGGNGGRGGAGGYGAPGTVKLHASAIFAEEGRVVASNGNGDTASNRLGRLTLISNLSGNMAARHAPTHTDAMLTGFLANDDVLKGPAPYAPSLQVPRLGQLSDGTASPSGFCAEGNRCRAMVAALAAEIATNGLVLKRLTGFYNGFDQIFVTCAAGSTNAGSIQVASFDSCPLPAFAAGGCWSVCVPAGSAVLLHSSADTRWTTNEHAAPVPYAWLLDNGLVRSGDSASAFNAAAMTDTDGDRMQAWEEYLAGTDPNDASSLLRIHLSMDESLRLVLSGSPPLAAGYAHQILGKTNLLDAHWNARTNSGHRYFRLKLIVP